MILGEGEREGGKEGRERVVYKDGWERERDIFLPLYVVDRTSKRESEGKKEKAEGRSSSNKNKSKKENAA